MKIISLHAENFKRLSAVDITPQGDLVVLSGANEQGKSSVLDAIMSALCGGRGMKDIPVLMLSARGEEYDKLHGFNLGIDDYVTKPFSPRELMARLNVIISRRKNAAPVNQNEVYQYDSLKIDMSARTVEIEGRRVNMTPKEYDLLFYLVRNKNIALSRSRLLSEVWGYDFFGDDATVNTHIKVLRQRLGEYEKLIVTIRGIGYRFDG